MELVKSSETSQSDQGITFNKKSEIFNINKFPFTFLRSLDESISSSS